MRSIRFLRLLVTLFCLAAASSAWSQQPCHFRRADIPPNESRLGELARVREFRVAYELAHPVAQTLLIAELYEKGKCVGRYRLSRAIFGEDPNATKGNTGVISIGWQIDAHNLVSAQDHAAPLAAPAHLPSFDPLDAYYFPDSSPEKRAAARKGGEDAELYPVLAICGARDEQLGYNDSGDTRAFLKACTEAGAKHAVIVYLYFSPFGAEPSLNFTK